MDGQLTLPEPLNLCHFTLTFPSLNEAEIAIARIEQDDKANGEFENHRIRSQIAQTTIIKMHIRKKAPLMNMPWLRPSSVIAEPYRKAEDSSHQRFSWVGLCKEIQPSRQAECRRLRSRMFLCQTPRRATLGRSARHFCTAQGQTFSNFQSRGGRNDAT